MAASLRSTAQLMAQPSSPVQQQVQGSARAASGCRRPHNIGCRTVWACPGSLSSCTAAAQLSRTAEPQLASAQVSGSPRHAAFPRLMGQEMSRCCFCRLLGSATFITPSEPDHLAVSYTLLPLKLGRLCARKRGPRRAGSGTPNLRPWCTAGRGRPSMAPSR